MIRINELKLPLDYGEKELKKTAARALKISPDIIAEITLAKRSVDARRKDNVVFSAAVDVTLDGGEGAVLKRCGSNKIFAVKPYRYELPSGKTLKKRPVVVGAGPAGLFAALILARCGHRPILIERGKNVDERTNDVSRFWSEGVLDPSSNVQFGEGGAGAFSDGKLNTGTKDPRSRMILEEFVAHGAPSEILWTAKPHIGTDRLKPTVKAIRNEIISLGGEVRFSTTLTAINVKNGTAESVVVSSADTGIDTISTTISTTIETSGVILALGHSARDTFEMLEKSGFVMQPKPFSVGVRIEHLQSQINKAQYGEFWDHPRLGAADYKLSTHLNNGRGVYTFCMCPGGQVVSAASEENTVVTNGMSEFARDGINANSALLVGVNPIDLGGEGALAGVEFQRSIERAAFAAGGGDYRAPAIRVGDLLKGRSTQRLGSVMPTYKPGIKFARPEEYLPGFVVDSICQALPILDRKLHGFADPDALLTGAETRSSSPVRILRGDTLEAVGISGVYPCGEGAGYAGGIMSAAADGVRCAEALIQNEN